MTTEANKAIVRRYKDWQMYGDHEETLRPPGVAVGLVTGRSRGRA